VKQGLEQAVIEFETVKKIIPLIVFSTVVLAILINFNFPSLLRSVSLAALGLMLMSIASLFMYVLTISKKEFAFYVAKTCFISALNKRDIFMQLYYFNLGLQEYNRYLKRRLKHQIKDINKIFSKVSILDNDAKAEVINSLSNSFEIETDKLKPLRYISSELLAMEPMSMKPEDIGGLLVQESLMSKLKMVGAILAAYIPIVILVLIL